MKTAEEKQKTIDEIGFEQLGSSYYQLKNQIVGSFWPYIETIFKTYATQQTADLTAQLEKERKDKEGLFVLLQHIHNTIDEKTYPNTRQLIEQKLTNSGITI